MGHLPFAERNTGKKQPEILDGYDCGLVFTYARVVEPGEN